MPDTGELRLFRAFDPPWASEPLSGAGASANGGRWNPIGHPCLYLAFDAAAAYAEATQHLGDEPTLIAQIIVNGGRFADLSDAEFVTREKINPQAASTPWRADLDAGRTPATHALAHHLQTSDFDGLIYPSQIHKTGKCLALWRWNATGGPRVRVIDSFGRLPKNKKSWR